MVQKRNALRRKAKFAVIILLLSAILGVLAAMPLRRMNAGGRSFLGNSATMSRNDLKAASNTYMYDALGNPDYSNKNESTVSENAPQITVLTHGLGGGAKDWSNNFHITDEDLAIIDNRNINIAEKRGFAYDRDSIISKLAQQADAEVYWAKSVAKFFDRDNREVKLENLQNREDKLAYIRPDFELMPLSMQVNTPKGREYDE